MKHGILKSKFSLLTGAILFSLAVLALAHVTSPTMASAASGIVISGPEKTSSNLKLTLSGDNFIVNGTFESEDQPGCEVTHGHNALSCPLSGVSQVEVNMGSANDKVEVLESLPATVHLVVHMGDGSDKFVGSDEADTCYPEGSANNSCEGGGGNDTCIAEYAATKCIGGSGNDVCKASAAGDACYGGPGDDVCNMGPGEGKCLGEAGNDKLSGEAGSDHLDGGSGNDQLKGGSGSDHLEGGTGNDTISGESSSDKLYGGPGNDQLDGGTSSDKLYGGPGNDHLNGGASPDKLYGEAGQDSCNGGPGVGLSIACESGPGH